MNELQGLLWSLLAILVGVAVLAFGAKMGANDAINGIAKQNKYWLNRLELEKLRQKLEAGE